MFHYRAFELNFTSAIELPDITPLQPAPLQPDVSIRIGATPPHLERAEDRDAWFQSAGRQTLLSNLYRPEYLRGLESEARVYVLATTVTSRTRLVEVAHNRDPERIEVLVDTLEREWRAR